MQLTKEGLLKALRAEGMPETATDLPAVEKWLADNPRRLVFDGKDVDLKAVFAPVVTLEPENKNKKADDPEPVIQLEEKVAAMVADALAKAGGRKPGDGAPPKTVNLDGHDDPDDRLSPEDVKVKSLEDGWKNRKDRVFETHERAYGFGCWLVKNVLSRVPDVSARVVDYASKGYGNFLSRQKQYLTFPTAAGGALTGTQFAADIIQQIDEFGTFSRSVEVVEVTETRYSRPRARGYLEVEYPEEGKPSGTTTQTWDNVTLLPKTGRTIVKWSREINEDAMANLGDHTARELARGFARREDLNGFLGDGTREYGWVHGLIPQFGDTAADTDRSVVGGDTTSAHTMPILHAAMAKLATWAMPGAAWHCTPQTAALVFDRLAAAQGGVTWAETMRYGYVRTFLGLPIITNNVMNRNNNTGGDVVDIVLGDLREAATLGRRKELTIELSDQRYWDEHNIAMKGVIRHDIHVHNAGADNGEPGPVVAIWQT